MQSNPRRLALLATLLLASSATAAKADMVLSADIDADRAITARFDIDLAGEPGIHESAYIGPVIGRLDGGAPFSMYCVDLFHDVIHPGYAVEVRPLADLQPAAGTGIDRTLLAKLLAVGTTGSRLEGAALQLAVWDTVYFGGTPVENTAFSSGLSNISSGVTPSQLFAQTDAFLDAARSYQGVVPTLTYFATVSGGQSMVTLTPPGPGPAAVPEPSSIVLSAFGLVALGTVLRRRSALARPIA